MTATELFQRVFKEYPIAVAKAPGRINLIGEHTDYNGGMVLPMTLPLYTEVAIGPSCSLQDEIYSVRFEEPHHVAVDAKANQHWSDYAAGALQAARKTGRLTGPMKMVIQSNVPDGAGLSSSAALIIAILKAAAIFSNKPYGIIELARLAQSVEHNHIGVPCGMMDQMVIAADTINTAMLLDTRSLEYSLIPIPDDWRIAVIHSGISRKLNDGRYALRRKECTEAAKQLGAEHLCLLTDEQKQLVETLSPLLRRRAGHIYRDHERVFEAVKAIKAKDICAFGAVLTQGHTSLRDAFEVTTSEIDRLVEISVDENASGARLSGGGFGGCIIAVLPKKFFTKWCDRVLTRFNTGTLIY